MNIKTIMGALFALTLPAQALPEAPDMDTALAQAKTEKKDIFVDFTGTDWCTACIHLRTKIVESEAFDKAYGSKYILVSVDFPRNPALVAKIPDEEKRRRENLLMSYRIEGLPGVVLMDENGMPYEIINGTRRTPEDYMPLMEAGLQKRAARDAAFAEAAKTVKKFLSVELSMGQMIEDIELAIRCACPVLLCNRAGGMIPSPEEVLAKIKEMAE